MRALDTLVELERTGRAATSDEQEALAAWSGWGALPLIFEPPAAPYTPGADQAEREAAIRSMALDPPRQRLRELLSEPEWADARRNTLNAHYTDPALAAAVWEGVRQLGFDGGHVLEPSSGSGIFIGLSPADTPVPVAMTGVEVEGRTAAMSRHLYPDATIITAGFEETAFTDPFDAVIGNVPFGRYQRYDRVYNSDLKLSIHDHFVLKSLALTRPGGITALITSRFTLDGKDPAARERMYELGDLVGAVRLPAGAHKATAGTDVVTDVLFLRRRAEGEPRGDSRWLTSTEQILPGHEEPVNVNDYVAAHPQYVLGELQARLGPFGPEPTVVGERDAAKGLTQAAAGIAATARESGLNATPTAPPGEGHPPRPRPALATEYLSEDALGLDEQGHPTIVEDGTPVRLEVHPDQRERLVQLIGLKTRTLALYEAEANTEQAGETPQLTEMRTALRDAYRAYRRRNPPPGKPGQRRTFAPKEAKERAAREGLTAVPDQWKARTAFSFIDDDPDASLLFGLEAWDERTGTATEQKVLHERVLEPRQIPETAKTPEDAVALAQEWDGGRLDMTRVASLLGVDEDEAARQCGHLAFRDPAQNGFWEPRHRYLSGNVREKLARARTSAAEDPSYTVNVSALERVQPQDLNPAEIKARCGAPWIPVEDYQAFLNHLGFEHAEVRHAGGTMWEVRGAHVGDLARSEWGTAERSAQDLMLSILRQADSTIQVTYRDHEGKTQVNQVATDAAREKARLIREAWDDWIWADKARSERLAGIYNGTFNALALPDYDTSPLRLPGSSDWKMRPHQNAAIRRILSEPTALLAHVVGAGKTATMVGGIMELRRTGLARKPAMVIPNHMLRQITREFREVYPNAKLLAISASDLGVKRRAKFMARAAGGDWDAVIMTHEAFNRIPLRPETQLDYIDTELSSLCQQLDDAAAAGMHERTIKQIENDLAAIEARMLKQVDESANGAGIFLEDTGIDYLMVDEAHAYKNLRTISAIPGAGIQGSVKATKLHMVLGHLRKTNGSDDNARVCTLATGTPIANSVTEAYVLKRYLAPALLDHQGLTNFDSWAATFGEVVSSLEPDAKGDGYKYKARFARFFNVPELMAAYRSFADVQNAEDLGLPVPPIRLGADGQRGESIAFPVTGHQRAFIKALPHQPWVREPGGVLKALGLGLRASLDMRLVGQQDEEAGSKLPYAAEQIAEIWKDTKDVVYPSSKDDPTPQKLPGGLQLVFLDEGTPGSAAANPVDLYDSLREHLVEQGVPREEIRFIHEASTDRKKDKLFADCRAGRVSVLVGSTEKMGTGTNIQDRAVALHHLSYPWRPADMAQRDGRVERQGNLNVPWIEGTPDHARILYYVTAGSFDEFRLTTLARKAKFIAQIQRKDFSVREIEDIGEEAINLGMLSALASGDPAILQLAEATADRARVQGLARTWDRQQDDRAQTVKDLDAYLQRAADSLTGMREAAPQRRPTAGDAFALTIDGRTLRSRDTAAKTLGARMVTIARDTSLRPGDRVPIGELGGLPFHGEISYDYSGHRQLKLRFDWGHTVPLGHRDDRAQWQATSVTQSTGRGAIVGLENFLNKLDQDAAKLEREITTHQGHRQDAANNLRPYEENPYRIQARSKEREERLLSQLVIVNEKKATLAERVENAGEYAAEADVESLEELTEKADALRALIVDEHTIQKRATNPNAEAATEPSAEPDLTAPGPAPEEAGTGSESASRGATAQAADGSETKPPDRPEPDRDTQESNIEPEPPAPGHAQKTEDPSSPGPDSEPRSAPDTTTPDDGVWENGVRELAAAGLLDEQVTAWARANDIDGLALPLAKWVGSHLADRFDDLDSEEWPDWVTAYFTVSVETRTAVVARVAATIHTVIHQPPEADPTVLDPAPAEGPDQPDREMTVQEMALHDARAMAAPVGATGKMFDEGDLDALVESWSALPQTTAPSLSDPELRQAAITAFTAAANVDESLATQARYLGQAPFTEVFHAWADTWFTEHWITVPLDDWPDWVTVYERAQGEDSRTDLLDQVATSVQERARRTSAPPERPAAKKEPTGPSESMLGPMLKDAFTEAEGQVTELFVNAALADDLVVRWVPQSESDSFAGKFTEWADAWVTGLLGDEEADDLPMPIRFFVHRASWETAERILAQAASTVHATVRQRTAQDDGPDVPRREPAVPAEPAEPVDPAVEAIRQEWLQSKDWRVKAVAEGRNGERIHLAAIPGYALVERKSPNAYRWEVVPANTGQSIRTSKYRWIASWKTPEREPAEIFARKLHEALRAEDGTPFTWPPPRKWRSADGLRLDRVIADVRAACDQDQGIEDSPAIYQAQLLADRDAQAEAAAEHKKAEAAAKRAATKPVAHPSEKKDSTDSRPADPAPTDQVQPTPSTPGTTAPEPRSAPTPAGDTGASNSPSGPVTEAEAEGDERVTGVEDAELAVITPDGPGRLMSLAGNLALVRSDAGGTRVYEREDIYHPGRPDAPLTDPTDVEKRRQNAADAAQASTTDGIHLRYTSNRLRDLDLEAGHGTIVAGVIYDRDTDSHLPGEVVGWVRARTGDNGKRYWWAQDAEGGPPDDMPFHENLPAKAGLPAIRAAGTIRTERKRSSLGPRRIITPPYAVREIKLTLAQVALLRTLPLNGTYPDGSELPTPPWVGAHRRYVMSVAQMQALRRAAEAAADACDLTTGAGRRTRKVLLNAVGTLHFEEYETGRRGASIPPGGEPDLYSEPYTPPPPRPDPDPSQAPTPAPAAAAEAVPAHEQEAPGIPDTTGPVENAPATGPEPEAPARPHGESPFPPQSRVFHNAMRYVVEDVTPDGTHIRTVSGHTLPAAEVVTEADMPPVTTEDLADGWWRYTYQQRTYTAALLPVDLLRTHPRATLSVVIVDQDDQLVGRAFGRPHESAIIWAAAHPAAPHPHIAEWLDTTPWPEYTDAERAHIAAGPPAESEPDTSTPDDAPAAETDSAGQPDQLPAAGGQRPQPTPPATAPGTDEPDTSATTPESIRRDDTVNGPDPEEYDMTAQTETIPDAPDTDAPDVEDPPEPEHYTETTPLTDPDYTTRMHGWDGQPAESGDLYYRDTLIASLRPSTGGGWFARLVPEGDVTPLTARPEEAAHQAAIYFSALTSTPYGRPVPAPQPDETNSRPDKVRTAVRNAAGSHYDRIATASAQAWPDTYRDHPQLQRLFDTLGDMQLAVTDEAGARRMEADLNAALQATTQLGATLPDEASDRVRQHMGFPLGYLTYDLRRLQAYLQAAVDATLAERAAKAPTQNTAPPGPDPRPADEPTAPRTAPETLTGPEPRTSAPEPSPTGTAAEPTPPPVPTQNEPAAPPEPAEPATENAPGTRTGSDNEKEPPPALEPSALPHDLSYQLMPPESPTDGFVIGEVRAGPHLIAEISQTAVGGYKGHLSDVSIPPYSTSPSSSPNEAAHRAAILNSAMTGRPYGPEPTAVQDTDTHTRAEILRAEMRALATSHWVTVNRAVQQTWPDGCAHQSLLEKLNEQLDLVSSAVEGDPTANQMHDQLHDAAWLANDWLDRIENLPDTQWVRQNMGFPLAAVVYDMNRLAHRLDVTAAAVTAERAAAEQREVPEPETTPQQESENSTPKNAPSPPSPSPTAEKPGVAEQTADASRPPESLPHDSRFQLHPTGSVDPGQDTAELRLHESRIAEISVGPDGRWYGRLLGSGSRPYSTTASDTMQEAAHRAAILHSATTGEPYGEQPTAAQSTGQATSANIAREEARECARAHRQALTTAAQHTWPGGDHATLLERIDTELDRLEATVEFSASLWEVHDQALDVHSIARDWLDRIEDLPDAAWARQNMGFPLAAVVYDMNRLAQRLDATAVASGTTSEAAAPAAEAEQAAASESNNQAPDQPATATSPQPVLVADEAVHEAEPTAASEQAPDPDTSKPLTEDTTDVPAPAVETVPTADGQPFDEPHSPAPEGDLPLWTSAGQEADALPPEDLDADEQGILSNIGALQEAWEAAVPDRETAHDLVAALDGELTALQHALDGTGAAPSGNGTANEDTSTTPTTQAREHGFGRDAGAVNIALADADRHHHALRDSPEWRELQTVRGATRNLWQAIKRETGAHFDKLLGDHRFQGWWKKTSIRVCERISDLALRAADRIRGTHPEPAAAIDRVHHAADAYSRPAPTPPAQPETQLRKLGEGLIAAQVKVNAARARSTTVRKPPAPRPASTDRPGHLRWPPAEPNRAPRQGR
ncbi:DEAD/DEAH box helicase family protein [Streptomyces baarnensis]|uniref:DEAD/DEAH box helicase family protein n=1 Tax=Streptomyces baarnensis TaxID=66872 RepID=UPI0030813C5A